LVRIQQVAGIATPFIDIRVPARREKLIRTATEGRLFAYQNQWRWLPIHSIACFFGLVFLVIFALIAIPILILVAKLFGLALIGGAIALIVLGIWKLFDLAEAQYRPY
jgi:hypothetical protein